MTVNSMTGFARLNGAEDGYGWVWEAKSLNSKGLDARFRMPSGFDHIETIVRGALGKKISRGSLFINLNLTRPLKEPTIKINYELLDQMIAIARKYRSSKEDVDVELLLAKRGVVELAEEDQDHKITSSCETAIIKSFDILMDNVVSARSEEGAKLKKIGMAHIGELYSLIESAQSLTYLSAAQCTDRLRNQIDEALKGDSSISEDRLAQEIAIIVARGDVTEEIDRLRTHVESSSELFSQGGSIGRQLDFLCQELNREANTLCSKSSNADLTKIGLSLKLTIERLREQIQNIE